MGDADVPPVGVRLVPIDDALACIPDNVRLAQCPTRFDIFICSLGFEDRCLAIPQQLADARCEIGTALIATFSTNPDENRRLEKELRGVLQRMTSNVTELGVDEANFASALGAEIEATQRNASGQLRIGWDVSVASNQAVMRILYALLRTDCELDVLYAEPEQYFPLESEFDADRDAWTDEERLNLDRGVLNVEYLSEYPGDHDSQLPHMIVTFPGFSRDRARRIIAKVDAEFMIDFAHAPVVWMISVPPAPKNRWRVAAIRYIQGIPEKHEEREVSTFDPRETLLALEQIYAKSGLDSNITISPLGSKMQAIGIALFCYAHPDVRAAFARPVEYNAKRYSTGIAACWRLALGVTADLRQALRRVGGIELVYDDAAGAPTDVA
jgi:hypothetical protein